MLPPRVLDFPRPDPLRELQAHLDERFDRLEAILCGEPLEPWEPHGGRAAAHPEAAQPPNYALARVLAYEPRR